MDAMRYQPCVLMDWSEQMRPILTGVYVPVGGQRVEFVSGSPAELCPLPHPLGVYALPQLRYVVTS